jgi:hypothetical protein
MQPRTCLRRKVNGFLAFSTVTALFGAPLSATELLPRGLDQPVLPQPSGALEQRAVVVPAIQAGHPAPDPALGIPPDSPSARVDPNTSFSPFAGVGSIFADSDPSDPVGFFGSGTAIDRWHVLTAGHLFDQTGIGGGPDGQVDVLPENAFFVLNYGSSLSHVLPIAEVALHADYTGTTPDDLAILTLAEPLPDGVPIYPLADPNWLGLQPLVLAGYGGSGDGVHGYFIPAAFDVKRIGANLLEYGELDDEGGPEVEVVAWDFEFEGDPSRYDIFGTPLAFPNHLETTLGPGDSGGPSFMFNPNDPADFNLYLAAVNTFSFWFPGLPDHDLPGRFGSGSGGVWLNSQYQSWVRSQLAPSSVPDSSTFLAEAGLAGLGLLVASRFCFRTRRSDAA